MVHQMYVCNNVDGDGDGWVVMVDDDVMNFPSPPMGEVKFNTSDVAALSTPRLPPNQSPHP